VIRGGGGWCRMTRAEVTSDYRVQELLRALNDGVLEVEFVKARLAEWVGEAIDLIKYSDEEYDIVSAEF
jgi:hypothetical protein